MFLLIASASYAQTRTWHDQQTRAHHRNKPQQAIYNMPFLYRLSSSHNTLSVQQLHHALQLILIKHS
ncbi:unnamed protein product, partial [Adineta steineri]